jgi:predicted glycoside hydrolase/deacetylase ChbG (UPF0249 family)
MKYIILCADDYGQTRAISQAIIDLLKNRRLTATSCMVTSSAWPEHASWLISYKNQVDIGLHFNLTEGKPIDHLSQAFVPLSHLLLKSHLRWLNKHAIRIELNAQLDQFISVMGMLPDFIDGHQHVHQFPIIRDALLEVYEERLRKHGCYIRCIDDPRALWNVKTVAYRKKLILQLSGAIALKKNLVKRNIPHNKSFSGVYSFGSHIQYESLFRLFLKDIEQSGLIMCHPGLEDGGSTDAIHTSRLKEYEFLNSEQCLKLLNEAQIKLVRFKELCSLAQNVIP